MKPRLILFKKELGKLEYPKTEVHFMVVDSDLSKEYPMNFVCVLPLSQSLHSGHSTFRKPFGEESIPLAKNYYPKLYLKKAIMKLKQKLESAYNFLSEAAFPFGTSDLFFDLGLLKL